MLKISVTKSRLIMSQMEERKFIFMEVDPKIMQYDSFRIINIKNEKGYNERVKTCPNHLPKHLYRGQEVKAQGRWGTYRGEQQFVTSSPLKRLKRHRNSIQELMNQGFEMYYLKIHKKTSPPFHSYGLMHRDKELLKKLFYDEPSLKQMQQLCFLHYLTRDITTLKWQPAFEPFKSVASGLGFNLELILKDAIRYFLRHVIPDLEFVPNTEARIEIDTDLTEDEERKQFTDQKDEQLEDEEIVEKREDEDFPGKASKKCRDYLIGFLWKHGLDFLQRAHQLDTCIDNNSGINMNKFRLGQDHLDLSHLQKTLYALSIIILFKDDQDHDTTDKDNDNNNKDDELWSISKFQKKLRAYMKLFPHYDKKHVEDDINCLAFIEVVPVECNITQRIKVIGQYIGRLDVYHASQECSDMLLYASRSKSTLIEFQQDLFEDCQPNKYTDKPPTREQTDIAHSILHHNVNILQGVPGSGKTSYVLKWVQKYNECLGSEFIDIRQHILAPTNAAVSLLSEHTEISRQEQRTRVRTITSCCWSRFDKQRRCFLVIDESSMVNIITWAELFQKLRTLYLNFHILIIGDKYQLEPIGKGYFFADLINMKEDQYAIKRHTLTRVLRQTNEQSCMKPFLTSCRNMADEVRYSGFTDKEVECSTQTFNRNNLEEDQTDLSVISCTTLDEIVKLYSQLYREKDGLEKSLIITPFRDKRMVIYTSKLNEMIQKQYNPTNFEHANQEDAKRSRSGIESKITFARRDPVVLKENVKREHKRRKKHNNKLLFVAPFLSHDLFNNMRGVIMQRHIKHEWFHSLDDEPDEKVMIMTREQFYSNSPCIIIRKDHKSTYFKKDESLGGKKVMWLEIKFWDIPDETFFFHIDYEKLDLAYAVTVHVAQGQTCDKVLCVIRDSPHPMIKNELVTTAVSRARKKAIICIHGNSRLGENEMKDVLTRAARVVCVRKTWMSLLDK